MKHKNIFPFFASLFFCTFSLIIVHSQQTKYQLIDKIEQKPIQYANIKAENTDYGTSSDSLGYFEFDKNEKIWVNAPGYEPTKIDLAKQNVKIELDPKVFIIKEVLIENRKNKNETIIDPFKAYKINQYYGMSSKNTGSRIVVKYFENKSYKTKFLKKIRLKTNSNVANATFNVRFYSVGADGKPENELYNQNVIGTAKRGHHKTEVDLSKTNLKIPENGIFIALDWIKNPNNYYEYNYTMNGSHKKLRTGAYSPSFGCVLDARENITYVLRNNQWTPAVKDMMHNSNKYCVLAMELTLTD